jgi:NitT/TauT family transport system permease protein
VTAGLKRLSPELLSITALFGVWWTGALVSDDALLFPAPPQVLESFWQHLSEGELLAHLGITLLRVGAAFCVSMAIGAAIGCAMGFSRRTDQLLDPWLILFLNVPALVVMILCYVWIGLTEAAAIIAVAINKVPNVAVIMREGARALDPQLAEMARCFRFNHWQRLRHLIVPQLAPYFAASARSGIALIWKIVLVVELLGRSNGMGFQLHLYFQLFDISSLLAYTLAFVLVMQLVELIILKPWERHLGRWRQSY